MIDISVEIDDQITEGIEQFASSASKLMDRILLSTLGKYAAYVRRGFLSGQMLGRRTGETARKMKALLWRRQKHVAITYGGLANIWEARGGVNIVPREKKILRWVGQDAKVHWARHVHLDSRPYMTLAAASFNFSTALDGSATKIFDAEARKRGLA